MDSIRSRARIALWVMVAGRAGLRRHQHRQPGRRPVQQLAESSRELEQVATVQVGVRVLARGRARAQLQRAVDERVRRPAWRAPARSHGCEATSMTSPGSKPSSRAAAAGRPPAPACRCARARRRAACRSAGRRGGRGRRAAPHARWRASRSTRSRRRASRPSRTSGHGSSRCHASHELAALLERQRDAVLGEQVVERHEVQRVEVAPTARAVVDLGEDRRVAGAPAVGQLLGVAGDAARAERAGDSRAPVDQRAEDVEDERADGHRRRD